MASPRLIQLMPESNVHNGLTMRPGPDQLRLEQQIEHIREELGAIAEVVHQINTNVEENHEVELDRLDRLKDQITRENQKLMGAIRAIRQQSHCDLKDPRTYIRCIEFIYKLIYSIFVFLCQLTFVVGNSFNTFLYHLPFPFSILVILSYMMQSVLIFIIFDTTLLVSTAGISHRSFIQHNSLFQRYNGAPQMIQPNMALYELMTISVYNMVSSLVYISSVSYQLVLGDVVRMVRGVSGRYISSNTVVEQVRNHIVVPASQHVRNHVVSPAVDHVREHVVDPVVQKVSLIANEVAKEQLSIMEHIPSQISGIALDGAHAFRNGAGVAAQGAGRALGRAAEIAADGAGTFREGAKTLAQGAGIIGERLREIDVGAARERASNAAESIYHGTRRFTSRFFGGKSKSGKSKNKSKNRITKMYKKYPVFSILTKNEQKEFDRTIAGKKIKKLGQIINNIDYSRIQPNPDIIYIIQFVLNISEKLFPIFVNELDKTIDVCKIMNRQGIQPISNPLFLKELSDIVTH